MGHVVEATRASKCIRPRLVIRNYATGRCVDDMKQGDTIMRIAGVAISLNHPIAAVCPCFHVFCNMLHQWENHASSGCLTQKETRVGRV